jgi:hypothetical protein
LEILQEKTTKGWQGKKKNPPTPRLREGKKQNADWLGFPESRLFPPLILNSIAKYAIIG